MSYNIEPRKVAGVVKEASAALEGKDFNHGEVLVGLAELLGRVIVDVGKHHVHMDDMKKVVVDHLERTVRIGAHATEKSIAARG
ncbi:MAG: hypothetical protein RJA99_3240 [Pseudomonadota bacterium]|jgi:hypothetical protein